MCGIVSIASASFFSLDTTSNPQQIIQSKVSQEIKQED